MTPTQRRAMEQALEALVLNCGGNTEGKAVAAIAALRAALAEPQQAAEPFTPDWTNYRQGLADGWAEGYEQGVKDERTSEDNIGIAGFGAKVDPARQNPYGKPQPAEHPRCDGRRPQHWGNT